jgi:type I restriction enzyme, S subunit
MSLENTRYIELTFINDLNEVRKQIRNTILFLFLAGKYGVSVLSDYLEGTQYGYTASAKTEGSIKLLRITDITEGKVKWDSVPFCECEKPAKYLLRPDDILVARTGGTTGKSFIVKDVPSNVVYASYLIRLRLKNESNPEFVSSFLNSYTYWSQLVELKRGAAQPNVNAEKLKKIILPKCSPDVQDKYVSYLNGEFYEDVLDTRINEILSLFDGNQALKAEHTYQLDLLKILRQQILQDAVQGKLVPQDPNDEPANKLLERIKAEKEQLIKEKKIKREKPLPEIKPEEIPFEIPENWVWCRLGELGICKTGTTPSTVIKEYFGKDIPFIKPADISLYGIKYDNEGLSYKGLDEGVLISCGSLLMVCIGGSIGKSYFNEFDVSCNQQINTITPLADIKANLLQPFLQSKYFQSTIWEKASGGTTPIVNRGKWENILIPLPTLLEQHRIVLKIEQLMKLCDELEHSIQQNQKYTHELLQVALKEALEQRG